ncbi:FAD-dependent oxidoreductase [Saccharomonospora xinjiangensis]|uniref:FAD-dependent oxidoreductase n=1 Tax=Saccharomonospora xinjiangensis TaxID=75294 RepID=UPI00351030E9
MRPREVVVLGYGMAGARLADEIRRRDPDGERVALTVVGAERHGAYNRVLLPSVVAGTMAADSVRLHGAGWAREHAVDLRLGVEAVDLDLRRRLVRLSDASELGYDTLVFATGSRPRVPPVEGLSVDGGLTDGVVAFRTLDDCARIERMASRGARIAVLGGGLLGLEAARALAGRGNRVTVVHPAAHVLDRQLDADAAAVLAAALRDAGIELRLRRTAARYLSGDGVQLDDGSTVAADLVVVCTGVRPDTALAERAGIEADGGIVVNDELRTSDVRVHALGDCARHPGTVTGLVQPAWDQAAVLADLLTGVRPSARYRGTSVVTRLKASGVDLTTLGDSHVEPGADAEVLRLHDPVRRRYAKLVLRDERVSSAIMLGFPDAAAALTHLYDRRLAAPSDRLALLVGRALPANARALAAADLPASAVVCRCNSVSKGRLVTAWRSGSSTVDELAAETRAGTGCGGCADTVRAIADWLARTA